MKTNHTNLSEKKIEKTTKQQGRNVCNLNSPTFFGKGSSLDSFSINYVVQFDTGVLFYTSYPPTHLQTLHAFHIQNKCAMHVYMKTFMEMLYSRYWSCNKCSTHFPLSYLLTKHPQLSSTMSI